MKRTKLWFLALCVLVCAACSDPFNGDDNGGNPTVYVAGYYENVSGNSVACYWKDGTRHDLSDGTTDGRAYSIAVVE
jgi:hypothetical protein